MSARECAAAQSPENRNSANALPGTYQQTEIIRNPSVLSTNTQSGMRASKHFLEFIETCCRCSIRAVLSIAEHSGQIGMNASRRHRCIARCRPMMVRSMV